MEETIVSALIEKYAPIGIILHGSRAGGYATEHSDWDFFLFTNETIPNKRKHAQETIEGQFLDIMIWQFPIEETDLKNYFAKYCGTAKVVYENDARIQEMFEQAQAVHKGGLHLSMHEIAEELEDINKGIERLSDWQDDDSGVFFVRAAGLFSQLYNMWWNIKNKQYSVSTRRGLVLIKEQDSEFYDLLEIVAGNSAHSQKIKALHQLKEIVFN